jgi:pilus assembly protein CpaE
MGADKNLVKLMINDWDTRKHFEDIIFSTNGFVVQGAHDDRRPDLLIFELSDEQDFEVIQSLIESDKAGEAFLVSGESDASLILRAMRTGAREFFNHPFREEEIQDALVRFKKRITVQHKTRKDTKKKTGSIINVMGGKGGTGTTTVAVNLAVSLAENKNLKVALIDMNLLFGEIPLFLSIESGYHWGEIIKNIARLDNTFLMNILSRDSSGIYVLPSPGRLTGGNISATPQIMEQLLRIMKEMFDYVIIDGGQSMNDIALKILEMSESVLVVSILSIPCLSNTNRVLTTFRELGYPPLENVRVIINRYYKQSGISIEDAEKAIESRIFWKIPNDYKATVSAINQGKPLGKIAGRAPITKNIRALADSLVPEEDAEVKRQKKRRWWSLSA